MAGHTRLASLERSNRIIAGVVVLVVGQTPRTAGVLYATMRKAWRRS
jgi:hypothetical protein